MLAFTLALLYPLLGLCAPVGHWQWDGSIPGSTASAVKTSLLLTAIALLIDVVIGTPVALHLARHAGGERIVWEAAILISALVPPLALGVLLSLSFGPTMRFGDWLLHLGLPTSNSPIAFTPTQVGSKPKEGTGSPLARTISEFERSRLRCYSRLICSAGARTMTEAQALGALVAMIVTLLVMLYELWRISHP